VALTPVRAANDLRNPRVPAPKTDRLRALFRADEGRRRTSGATHRSGSLPRYCPVNGRKWPSAARSGRTQRERPPTAKPQVRGRSKTWWRVEDSNLRSFRDGFTERIRCGVSAWPPTPKALRMILGVVRRRYGDDHGAAERRLSRLSHRTTHTEAALTTTAESPEPTPPVPTNSPTVPESQDPSVEDRLWQHALHVDTEYVQRGNFYLLGQSMLVVAYAAVLSAGPSAAASLDPTTLSWIARVLAGVGILLGLVWAYVSHSQWAYLKFLRDEAIRTFPDFAERRIRAPRPKPDDGAVSAYAAPWLTVVMWVVLALLI
jgi:hypothetical protein